MPVQGESGRPQTMRRYAAALRGCGRIEDALARLRSDGAGSASNGARGRDSPGRQRAGGRR